MGLSFIRAIRVGVVLFSGVVSCEWVRFMGAGLLLRGNVGMSSSSIPWVVYSHTRGIWCVLTVCVCMPFFRDGKLGFASVVDSWSWVIAEVVVYCFVWLVVVSDFVRMSSFC